MTNTVVTTATTRRTTRWTEDRIAGLCGVGFASLIVIQNVLRGATAPPNDAPAAAILSHVSSPTHGVLLSLFPVGGVLLLVFVAGLYRRLREDVQVEGLWAVVGLVGGIFIAAMFAVSNGFLAVLSASADSLAASPVMVETLWQLHTAMFAFNMLGIGLALFGFARATAATGLVSGRLAVLAQFGAGLLIVASGTASQQVQGSPLFFIALPGFLTWVVFVAVVGWRLARSAQR